jgi:error-prone DNA polymerase
LKYAELHCRSAFSFRDGASLPEDLVIEAARQGLETIALVDRDGVYGAPRFWKAARTLGLRTIVGADVTVPGGRLVLLCESQRGYKNLCRLITAAHLGNERGKPCASWESIEEHAGGLVALVRDASQLDRVLPLFPKRVAIELQRHYLSDEERTNQQLLERARALHLPFVATNDVRYAAADRRRLYDAMVCIRHLCTIDEAGTRLLPNGEFRIKSPREMAELFRDLPQAIAGAVELADRCAFSLDDLGYRFPPYPVPVGASEASHLRTLAFAGARNRYGEPIPARARKQLEHELDLIAKLELAGYFLIVWDIVEFARSKGILVQGRGSAANSAVCYALGITAVDPIGMELLFERFLSEARGEWPDIDLDLPSGDPREEVIQYVYQRYGRLGAAMTAEVITYRGRSSVRDLGKVLGLPMGPIDRLAKQLSPFEFVDSADTVCAQMAEAGMDATAPRVKLLAELAAAIEGLPRHLSQHSGGMVITAGRLDEVVPLEPAAMPGRVVVQWDKDDCADMKIIKVDLLGLGMMAVLADCVRMLPGLDLAKLPPNDPKTYDMLQKADTVGVFQVESRAQMSCLPRLRPKCFYDIVVEVALIRPGPIQGHSVHPYLARRAGREPVTYAHPCLEPILKRTLGVPLFQEQGMRIAMEAAGFTAAEAEELRRAMGHKRSRQRMREIQGRLMDGMKRKGISDAACERIWEQLMAFADYGFPECVVGETRILDASTGRWIAIEDLVHGREHIRETYACTPDFKLKRRRVIKATPSGKRPVLRVKTALGRTIIATPEHPLLTFSGWKPVGALKMGDSLAAARALPDCGKRRWPRHKIVVLADLIAEGNLCHPTTFYFYTQNKLHRDEFIAAVERFPNTQSVTAVHHNCFSVHVRRKDRSKLAGAVKWAQELGLRNLDAHQKKLPPEVFELASQDLALLLARLWEGDGHISCARHFSYDTASPQLAQEIQHLLLRFGIIARVYERTRPYRDRTFTGYTVTITGAEGLIKFYRRIGRRFLDPTKRAAARDIALHPSDARMSRDIIPVDVRSLLRTERERLQLTWIEIEKRSGVSVREIQSRGISKLGFRRWVIGRVGRAIKSDALCRLGDSDVYWDRIISIEPYGVRETYDLHIDRDHNFLANDLVVHNSHSASFALLVYASTYLKAHEHAVFTCAMLNNWPLGFYHPSTLIKDAERHGVTILPPDVTRSNWLCTLEEGKLRIGLRYVHGLRENIGKRIESSRPFASIEDFARRVPMPRRDLESLATAGAFAGFALDRREALWRVPALSAAGPLDAPPDDDQPSPLDEMTARERQHADYEVLGMTTGPHPMALARNDLVRAGVTPACELAKLRNGQRVRVGGVAIVRQRPGTAKGFFFLTLEDETGLANVIVTPKTFAAWRNVLVGSPVILVDGVLQYQDGVINVRGHRFHAWKEGGPDVSRDFR